jgi:glycosyltransferase involved in cell wall biosynthesis
MKLLFVTGSLVHGGAERHTITLANRLAERGHACRLAYVKNDPSQLERLRIKANCLEAQRYLDLNAVRELRRQITSEKPDVVIASNPYALMYATLAGLGRRVPTVVVFHSNRMLNLKEEAQLAFYRPMFWAAQCAVFVSERQQEHWQRRRVSGRRDEVIYNGVDTEQWRPWCRDEERALRRALGFADTDFVIAMSAVLRPEKNPLELIEAVAMLRRRGLPARALLIGDGGMREAIATRARELGIARDVAITGFQQEVRPFVAACDVLALTSLTEALSLAAIEAMALGKPVVHSDVGGAAELVRPGRNGFLYPLGDTGALADRLAQLAEPGVAERMGARAREAVETRFSERAMLDRYEKLFQELATARSKKSEHIRNPAGAH